MNWTWVDTYYFSLPLYHPSHFRYCYSCSYSDSVFFYSLPFRLIPLSWQKKLQRERKKKGGVERGMKGLVDYDGGGERRKKGLRGGMNGKRDGVGFGIRGIVGGIFT